MPYSEVAIIRQQAFFQQLTIRQQYREIVLVADNLYGVATENVGTVRPIGNASEAFGLALRTQDVAGQIQSGESCIVFGANGVFHLQREVVRDIGNQQLAVNESIVAARQSAIIDLQFVQFQMFTVQSQSLAVAGSRSLDCRSGAHNRAGMVQVKFQFNFRNQKIRRLVISQVGSLHGEILGIRRLTTRLESSVP